MKKAAKLLAGVALLVGAGTSANAIVLDPIVATGTFRSDHCGDTSPGTCGPQASGFATITATDHQNGTIDIQINLLNGNLFTGSGFGAGFGFNLDPNISITYSNLDTSLWSIPNSVGGVQTAGSLNMDGFGNFEYGVDGTFKGSNGPSSLSFTISGIGLDLSDFAQLSTNPPGDLQAFMALDIYSGTTGNTGIVDLSGGPTPFCVPGTCPGEENPPGTPIPGAVWLFGTVLAGGAGYGRWRKRKQTAKAA